MRLAVCLHFKKAESYRGANVRTDAKGANGGLVYSPSEISSTGESAARSTEGS